MSTPAWNLEGGPELSSKSGRRSSPWSWRWSDRIVLALAWTAGIGLCLVSASIVLYMGYRYGWD